jgi:hypothetical protein
MVGDILWVYHHHLDVDNRLKSPSPGARAMHSVFHPSRNKGEADEGYKARTLDSKELFVRRMLGRVMPSEASIDAQEKTEEAAVDPLLGKLDKLIREFESDEAAAAAAQLEPQGVVPVAACAGAACSK